MKHYHHVQGPHIDVAFDVSDLPEELQTELRQTARNIEQQFYDIFGGVDTSQKINNEKTDKVRIIAYHNGHESEHELTFSQHQLAEEIIEGLREQMSLTISKVREKYHGLPEEAQTIEDSTAKLRS